MEKFVMEMHQIEKQFSGVKALINIDFSLKPGEIHALLGGNGAGKSTLIKVLGGIYKPDAGQILINGKLVNIQSVQDAQKQGIGIIHQEIVLVPYLSVAENIFLGREPVTKLGIKDTKKIYREAQAMIDKLGIDINAKQLVEELSIAKQQIVEIVKAISFDVKILVMDEPTSSLEENEVVTLFSIMRNLKEQGVSIIYISHKMEEIFRIADRITVIRDGTYVGTCEAAGANVDDLINMMVGKSFERLFIRTSVPTDDEVLRIENISKNGVFKNINFTLHRGEVLGFAGLVGAGRSEIMSAIFGADKYDSGQIYLEKRPVRIKSPGQAIANGIAMVPENRKKQGLILINTVGFNITLANIKSLCRHSVIDKNRCRELIKKYIKTLNVKTSSANQIIQNLSGGNQQKAVLAKWLAINPKVLILDEPTRGIDIGAKQEIYSLIDKLSAEGMGIIMISSELPEIINMCDNVCVVREGNITAQLSKTELSQSNIMKYATKGEDKDEN